tara:strand:+ start:349 stop:468 length:120 start_codon:yes stop_codon:yes gene_type:complete
MTGSWNPLVQTLCRPGCGRQKNPPAGDRPARTGKTTVAS